MRFTKSAINSAIFTATRNPTFRMSQKQSFASLRQYSSQATNVKKGDARVVFGVLLGAGLLGGYAFKNSCAENKQNNGPFSLRRFTPLTLKEIEPVSSDTNLYRFQLPEGQRSNLPIASFLLVKYNNGKGWPLIRPYTPVSKPDTEGHIEFVIKSYKEGKMSSAIREMQPGDQLEFRGPIVAYNLEKNKKSQIGMIAGGAGITPMLQVIHGVFNDSSFSNTKITLLFGNQTEQDILLKEELDKIARDHPDRFKVVYALDKAPEGWDGVSGYITKEVIEEHMPSPNDDDAIIMVCGPPPMVKSIAGDKKFIGQGNFGGILKELGYSKKNVFKF